MNDDQPSQLPLTEEQQELIHRLTGEHANVLVFRARTQFRQKGLESSRLIERRPASRQVRFGYSAFEETARAE